MMLHPTAVTFVFCYMLGLAAAHLYSYIWPVNEASMQGVTKRCHLSWLTNSALVYEPKCGGWNWGVSANEYSVAQIYFGDLTPYLIYASMYIHCGTPYVHSEGYVLYIRLQNKHKFLISAYNIFCTLEKLATHQRTENIFICYWFTTSRYRSIYGQENKNILTILVLLVYDVITAQYLCTLFKTNISGFSPPFSEGWWRWFGD
jgi:hypothetical protein